MHAFPEAGVKRAKPFVRSREKPWPKDVLLCDTSYWVIICHAFAKTERLRRKSRKDFLKE